ncbi:hypothetical protein KGM_200912 [Danaus plexippus plexippus]|uniref:Uncharacterized protein n=1 Tax=Danaus plexippus plexippus TaxID=278856 RepID=A0A212ETK2_DANPL|nr:hypothetical protein KGM_200912 [Danaus plexippus plexippus]
MRESLLDTADSAPRLVLRSIFHSKKLYTTPLSVAVFLIIKISKHCCNKKTLSERQEEGKNFNMKITIAMEYSRQYCNPNNFNPYTSPVGPF